MECVVILMLCWSSGIIGGLTSVITSTVEGVKTEGGVSGFFSGLGKGLVGTVTKPVAGALDFASETAQTVRDMASLSNHRYGSTASPTCTVLVLTPSEMNCYSVLSYHNTLVAT